MLEQHIVATGNTTRLKWLVELLLRVCIIMNGNVSEKNLFIGSVRDKRNILRWVRIQNAVHKWASLLILLKYDAPVLNLFCTHSKAAAIDVVLVSDENHLLYS